MSLKNVHVVFIAAATLLALVCAAVALQSARDSGSLTGVAAAAGALVAAGVLVRYETGFLRRCRKAGIQ
jgi:hypothetical protein